MIADINPVFERPIFLFTSAARMKDDDRLGTSTQQFLDCIPVGVRLKYSRREIINPKPQLFERLRKLAYGVLMIINLRGSADEFLNTAPAQIILKTREIVCEFCRRLRILRKETGERSVLD